MNQKWNLQDIRPAKPRPKRISVEPVSVRRPQVAESRSEADEVMSIDITDGNKKKSKSLFYALAIFFVVVGAGFIASFLMSGAEVTVFPKQKELNVNALFSTSRTPQPDELAYEIMTLEASGERQVSATGQEDVTTQAEGTILIYNKQQKDSVRLITNTRFESPEGLIFKIKDSAVVPGYTTADDGEIIPGVTTADVYADVAGEEYNITPSSFTIPGFKNYPEYKTVYAESIENMSSGFNGKKFIIDDEELQTAQQTLHLELRNTLLNRIEEEMPAGFILFDGAVTFSYISLPSVEYGDDLASIKEKVIMRIPLFKEDEFAAFLAKATIPGYEGGDVRVEDYDALTFKYEEATTSSSDISLYESLSFNLTGKPTIVWEYDSGKLKTDLLNTNKTALPTILSSYPAIRRAEAVIRPFWKTKFPTSLNEIEIIEILSDE